jgi:hypothetical protein
MRDFSFCYFLFCRFFETLLTAVAQSSHPSAHHEVVDYVLKQMPVTFASQIVSPNLKNRLLYCLLIINRFDDVSRLLKQWNQAVPAGERQPFDIIYFHQIFGKYHAFLVESSSSPSSLSSSPSSLPSSSSSSSSSPSSSLSSDPASVFSPKMRQQILQLLADLVRIHAVHSRHLKLDNLRRWGFTDEEVQDTVSELNVFLQQKSQRQLQQKRLSRQSPSQSSPSNAGKSQSSSSPSQSSSPTKSSMTASAYVSKSVSKSQKSSTTIPQTPKVSSSTESATLL